VETKGEACVRGLDRERTENVLLDAIVATNDCPEAEAAPWFFSKNHYVGNTRYRHEAGMYLHKYCSYARSIYMRILHIASTTVTLEPLIK
jgi:hypothetical protein